MKKISILGGGWLGLALAKNFKNEYEVLISSRTIEKIEFYEKENLKAFVFNETNLDNLDNLLDVNYLFINFPPSKFDDYIGFLSKIYENPKIKNIEKIIFISSTSIYPNEDGIFIEDIKITNSVSKKVFDAEELVKNKSDVIFRCAGLMGDTRVAGKYFSGKEIDSGKVRVNHIHRDDIIEATKFVIKNDISGIFNLCAKEHPTRKELYDFTCEKFGFEKPIYIKDEKYKNRIIDGSKIETLGFEYKYPNPLTFQFVLKALSPASPRPGLI